MVGKYQLSIEKFTKFDKEGLDEKKVGLYVNQLKTIMIEILTEFELLQIPEKYGDYEEIRGLSWKFVLNKNNIPTKEDVRKLISLCNNGIDAKDNGERLERERAAVAAAAAAAAAAAKAETDRLECERLECEKLMMSMCTCPITYEFMKNPVMCADGHSYEKSAIDEWFKYNDTSPLTNLRIPKTYFPNHALKNLSKTIKT
jgi:hypothetical protein